MNLKKLVWYLRVNLLGPGPRLMKKNIPGRGPTKVEKHWPRRYIDYSNPLRYITGKKSKSVEKRRTFGRNAME